MKAAIRCVVPLMLVMLVVRTASKASIDKAPFVVALGLLILWAVLNEWPQTALFYLRGTGRQPRHPRVQGANKGTNTAARSAVSQIDSICQLLGTVPRRFPAELRGYLKVHRPLWLWTRPSDEMNWAFRHQKRIRAEGKVLWAAIVQANNLMFRVHPIDCGASIIFSEDPWFDSRPEELSAMAHALFRLKGTHPVDPDSHAFATMLTDELIRGMLLKVPMQFSAGRAVFHTSILLSRKHLPLGFLSGRCFPIWLDPEGSGAALVVPAAYWPQSLLTEWGARG